MRHNKHRSKQIKWIFIVCCIVLVSISNASFIAEGGSPVLAVNTGSVAIYTGPALQTTTPVGEGASFWMSRPALGGLPRWSDDSSGNWSLSIPFWMTLLTAFGAFFVCREIRKFFSAGKDTMVHCDK